jgi:hypothetical protein
MAEKVPRAEMVVIEGAGHVPNVSRPVGRELAVAQAGNVQAVEEGLTLPLRAGDIVGEGVVADRWQITVGAQARVGGGAVVVRDRHVGLASRKLSS